MSFHVACVAKFSSLFSLVANEWRQLRATCTRHEIRKIENIILGNMRANGVRSLAITCGAPGCYHDAILGVSALSDDVTVPFFGPRMVCTVCGRSVPLRGQIGMEAQARANCTSERDTGLIASSPVCFHHLFFARAHFTCGD